jgi:hypothetical protein
MDDLCEIIQKRGAFFAENIRLIPVDLEMSDAKLMSILDANSGSNSHG